MSAIGLSDVLVITSPRQGAKYCDEYVCLSVCLFVCLLASSHISRTGHPNVITFGVTLSCGRRCDSLRTSGFVDDVMFSHNGLYGLVYALNSTTVTPRPKVIIEQ